MKGYQRFSSSNLHRDPIPGPSPCLLWAVSQKCTLWSTCTAGGLRKRAALTQSPTKALAQRRLAPWVFGYGMGSRGVVTSGSLVCRVLQGLQS